ncbi:MAG: [citrate (pro-3S)-lyase] ligase [Candidatus Avoscillospira sp.]
MMTILEGRPFTGRTLARMEAFLASMGLRYDGHVEYSVCLLDEDFSIVAAGSLEGGVLKCLAVSPDHQGEGLAAALVSQLVRYAAEQGRTHLFLYTKPDNQALFAGLGFYPILKTGQVLFMENKRDGFRTFLDQLRQASPACDGTVGAIVANCNPFTLGHRYLVEQALQQCDLLHLFILSEDRSFFSAKDRFRMARAGTADLPRLVLHGTGDYLISHATFPTYFFKDQAQAGQANCQLDLELFARAIAPVLGITRRFVGTEPLCPVTAAYNEAMKALLPPYGIAVTELPRLAKDGVPISASEVRRCLARHDEARLRQLVPEPVAAMLLQSKPENWDLWR